MKTRLTILEPLGVGLMLLVETLVVGLMITAYIILPRPPVPPNKR